MAIGMHLENCKNVVITGGKYSNLDIGVNLKDSELKIDGTEFSNVGTAIKGSGETPIDAQNVRHTQLSWGSESTPLDLVRKFANGYV